MTVKFYNTASEKERVDKVLNNETTVSNVYMKDVSNVLNPVLFIAGQNAQSYNYCYIQELQRYYFAENKGLTEANTIEYQLSVDVLMTYKTQIRNLTALIKMQENNYDLYLKDTKIPEKAYKRVQTFVFPVNHFSSNNSFVLGTVGK